MRSTIITVLYLFYLTNTFGQTTGGDLKIAHLTGDFYIFTTYNLYKGTRIPANGMYLVTNSGVVMFDTPWDTTQFQPLLDSIQLKHNKKVLLCIATHFHEDRTGGFEYYRRQGIKTFSTKKTDELCKAKNFKRAEFLFDKDTVFAAGQYSFRTYFPGWGHTPDNIVIWFEKEKILYGGCLIKSVEDDDLGNLADASVTAYSTTIKNVQKKCSKPRFVIPGHSSWINAASLEHTLKMAQQLQRKNQH
jgi:metallo-beta-lactamase class B